MLKWLRQLVPRKVNGEWTVNLLQKQLREIFLLSEIKLLFMLKEYMILN